MDLPQALRIAIDRELESQSPQRLAESAAALSKRYRSGQSSNGNQFLRSREDISAYAAFRMPATFAAVYAALKQVQDQLPDWSPQTLLDVGAGPGTAMWAASAIWSDLKHITLFEREEGMIALGKRLATYSTSPQAQEATWVHVDVAEDWETSPHDLVIASYVLGELSQDARAALVHKLWDITSGTLVLVEPGTPDGFSRIVQARQQLLAAGATILAPCPHEKPCPNDWCHFAQRIARSRLHRHVKTGELSYEDEKFSFVGVSRMRGAAIRGRVIRYPQIRKGHIRLEICAPDGLTSTVITRKDRDMFHQARDLNWGSAWPFQDGAGVDAPIGGE